MRKTWRPLVGALVLLLVVAFIAARAADEPLRRRVEFFKAILPGLKNRGQPAE